MTGRCSLAQMSGSFAAPGGRDLSPQLSCAGAPAETGRYTVTMYDADAPSRSGFGHRAIVDIPASVTRLPARAATAPALGVMPGGYAGLRYGWDSPPMKCSG